ncbi:hypothetical protein GGI00_004730 [Coemansia sp. RSA 2681]|nr:hypothetical protein GGI00_004730 [Coemansia sp. RSA 2681]
MQIRDRERLAIERATTKQRSGRGRGGGAGAGAANGSAGRGGKRGGGAVGGGTVREKRKPKAKTGKDDGSSVVPSPRPSTPEVVPLPPNSKRPRIDEPLADAPAVEQAASQTTTTTTTTI